MNIQELPIGQIQSATYNPRKDLQPGDPEYEKILRSVKEFGFVDPLVVNKTTGWTLVGGHQRLKVLKALGYTKVHCVIVELDLAREKALNIALNKIGGSFDLPMLKECLADIDQEIDVTLTGFDAEEIADLLDRSGEPEGSDDHVPSAPEKTVTVPGDIWQLGDHLVVCGEPDAQSSYAALGMPGERAAMVLTDPSAAGEVGGNHGLGPSDKVAAWLRASMTHAEARAALYVWHHPRERAALEFALTTAGMSIRQDLIWARSELAAAGGDYRTAHDSLVYASRAGQDPAFYGDRAQPTVWRAAHRLKGESAAVIGPGIVIRDGRGGLLHIVARAPRGASKARSIILGQDQSVYLQGEGGGASTVWEVSKETGYKVPGQKPVELSSRAVTNSSKRGESVLDPFGGLGTTVIACEKSGRRARVIEASPRLVDIAVLRWQFVTKRVAVTSSGKVMKE